MAFGGPGSDLNNHISKKAHKIVPDGPSIS